MVAFVQSIQYRFCRPIHIDCHIVLVIVMQSQKVRQVLLRPLWIGHGVGQGNGPRGRGQGATRVGQDGRQVTVPPRQQSDHAHDIAHRHVDNRVLVVECFENQIHGVQQNGQHSGSYNLCQGIIVHDGNGGVDLDDHVHVFGATRFNVRQHKVFEDIAQDARWTQNSHVLRRANPSLVTMHTVGRRQAILQGHSLQLLLGRVGISVAGSGSVLAGPQIQRCIGKVVPITKKETAITAFTATTWAHVCPVVGIAASSVVVLLLDPNPQDGTAHNQQQYRGGARTTSGRRQRRLASGAPPSTNTRRCWLWVVIHGECGRMAVAFARGGWCVILLFAVSLTTLVHG
jgi:hypothetical protein